MGESTKIGWTDSTFNPWWGCLEVGPGCAHCYAKVLAARWGFDVWGLDATYRTFGDKHWNEPLKWQRKAAADSVRSKVFSGSMCDVFDKRAPDGARPRLFELIKATPDLDWLLVTKRIGNAMQMLPEDWGNGYPNVWLIATIVNQPEADRDLDKLLDTPARIHGVSYEPALGPVDWTPWLAFPDVAQIDWIIGGGESKQGNTVRECKLEWLLDTAQQCKDHGAAYFNKQLGGAPTFRDKPYRLVHDRQAGADQRDWPAWLQLQEFPK